jgi:propionate CoA-transferase
LQNYDQQYNPALSGEIRAPLEIIPALPLDEKKVALRRAAMELRPRSIVNLGVGLPSGVGNISNEEKMAEQITLTVNYSASIDHANQLDFIDGGGLDMACLGFAECDGTGNVNASRFSGRVSGCGGFINISQNAKKVVFVGTFSSGGLKTRIEDGRLHIENEGKHKKFVERVGQVTFSGTRAAREGRPVVYVTERCVFALREGGPDRSLPTSISTWSATSKIAIA